jgi:hypothetical protein
MSVAEKDLQIVVQQRDIARTEQPAVTPMALVQMAVQQGADIDKLTKLLDLQLRWSAEEARKAFIVALNEFKADAPQIIKTKEVSFGGAGKTAYKHALAGVASEVIGEALARHGLSHRWDVVQADGKIKVTCILTHAQGHSERVSLEATPDTSGSKNSIQASGSTVSYLQRYSLFAATGLVPKDADDDAQQGAEHKMPESQRADFDAAIEALDDLPGWTALWAKILECSTAVGDIEAHEYLRTLMAARRKELLKK